MIFIVLGYLYLVAGSPALTFKHSIRDKGKERTDRIKV
jgi:hypothetical protein